ncbi:MAG: hypothetical protein ABFS32_10400 [Bacteroidota bacterium]
MKVLRIIFVLTLLPMFGLAQINRDSLFNAERTMDRRYALYKGQIRVEGTYGFSIFKSEFDESGNKEPLSDRGISSNMHTLGVNVRVGIIDYLDFEARFKHKKQNYRGEPVYIIGAPAPPLQLYTDVVTTGLEDIYLGLNGIIPLSTRNLDVGGSAGVYLPLAESTAYQPEHSLSSDEWGDIVSYYFENPWGYGVLSYYYKGFLKYRFTDFAIFGSFESRVPLGVSENLAWSSRLNDNDVFVYESTKYEHQVPQKILINLQAEYQLYDWVNVFFGYSRYMSQGGWSEESGNKIAIPEEKLNLLSPGYEILVSSKLWLRQSVLLPLSGESAYSPFRIQTTFYYNLFAF